MFGAERSVIAPGPAVPRAIVQVLRASVLDGTGTVTSAAPKGMVGMRLGGVGGAGSPGLRTSKKAKAPEGSCACS